MKIKQYTRKGKSLVIEDPDFVIVEYKTTQPPLTERKKA